MKSEYSCRLMVQLEWHFSSNSVFPGLLHFFPNVKSGHLVLAVKNILVRDSGTDCEGDRCTHSEVKLSGFCGSPCRVQWDGFRKALIPTWTFVSIFFP